MPDNTEFKVERFNKLKHRDSANILLQSREMTEAWTAILPRFGFIVHQGDVPVAMGFIRLLEGKMGVLDSYIANRESRSAIRKRALSLISYEIVEFSKGTLKLKGLIAFSDHPNIIQLATDHKFTTHPNNVFQSLSF